MIGQFHFVNALVSPLEVKVRSPAVCTSCRTHDCIRGNKTQRGCELHLFQPRKIGNFDCTFCLDCVQACPQDNVGLLATIPGSALLQDRHSSGIGRLSKRPDAAALAWILVFGALINAAAMVDPVTGWMHSPRAALGFYLAGILATPAALGVDIRHSAARWARPAALGRWRSFGFALVPLGFSMWVAHFSYHLLTGWRSIVPVFERILRVSTPAMNSPHTAPDWLPAAQILLLDAGLVLSLYIVWRTARRQTAKIGRALGLVTPWAVLAIGIYAASVWILFQPMQMRGMVM